MTEQLALDGSIHIVGLTERQEFALLEVERLGGAALDEVGAAMHNRQGKHSADSRCSWCKDAGASVMFELRQKDLVSRRQGGFWVSTRARPLDTGAPRGAGASVSSGAGVGEQAVTGPAAKPTLRCRADEGSAMGASSGELGGEPDGFRDSRASARSTDPATSHQAAASVHLNGRHDAVLDVFRRCGPMTDEQLWAAYVGETLPAQSESGLRTRRHELVEAGLLRDSGERGLTAAGRSSIVWEITAEGREALRACGGRGGQTEDIPF